MKSGRKSGPFPHTMLTFFSRRSCSNSASLTPASVWLAFFGSFHTPWVRLPAEWTKVVTMNASLKLKGLETFFLLNFSKSSNDFSVFRSWKSEIASRSVEHRATAAGIWNFPPARLISFYAGFLKSLTDDEGFWGDLFSD